jgi:hypothetical protein
MLTQAELKQLFHYDPITGIFTRIKTVNNRAKANQIAGCKMNGYLCIRIKPNRYGAHRLAWLYMTGKWPDKFIDHINHNREDNRWCNLREANFLENARNFKIGKNNTSGFKGICKKQYKNYEAWRAFCRVGGKPIYLGTFKTKEEASKAYTDFAKNNHKEFFSYD